MLEWGLLHESKDILYFLITLYSTRVGIKIMYEKCEDNSNRKR
jgi:hypothetical protein